MVTTVGTGDDWANGKVQMSVWACTMSKRSGASRYTSASICRCRWGAISCSSARVIVIRSGAAQAASSVAAVCEPPGRTV